jgi:photosystem II stability/assembly factor-like uncharacterized protein
MNTFFPIRFLGVCLSLAFLIPSLAGHADPPKRAQKRPERARTATKRKPQPVRPPSAKAIQLAALANKKDSSQPKTRVAAVSRENKVKVERPRGTNGGEYFRRRVRVYPDNFLDPGAFDRAIVQRSRLPAARINPPRSGRGPQSLFPSATWSYVGPVNWYPTSQRAYYGVQPMNGHVESIAVNPTNRLHLYVAGQTGGVFKTIDGGITWKSVSANWPYLRTNVVAINPRNPQVVYAGTGTSPTGFGTAIGLMKTTDGGTTWTNIGANKDASGNYLYFAGTNVSEVLVDPQNGENVTVLTGDNSLRGTSEHPPNSNIWNSTNGGQTWSSKIPRFSAPNGGEYIDRGSWDEAVITRSGVYLAAGTGPPNTAYNYLLYRSTDRGNTWAQVANAPFAPNTTPRSNGARLAASPVNANTVYLLYAFSDSLYLFKSVDNGANWTDISVSSGLRASAASTAEELDQVPYDYYMACSSRTVNGVATDVLYIGLKSVHQYIGTLGNTVWKDVASAFGANADIHSDQHCIAFDPTNPDRGWFGNDGGIYQFYSNPTNGTTNFQSLNDGLQLTQVANSAYHPTNPNIMIAGTQDNGTSASLGDLNLWQMPTGGDAFAALINPQNPLNMYSTYTNGLIYRSDDMFTSNYEVTPDLSDNGVGRVAFETPLAMDSTNPKYVYIAGKKLGRYDATRPLATAWTYFPTVLTESEAITLAVSPLDGRRIYVSTIDGKLLMTTNGGTSWVTLKAGTDNEALPNRNVTALLPDPDPNYPNGVFVGLSGVNIPSHLYYCENVTAASPTWSDLSGTGATALPDAPLNTIAVDPADANILYVGTDIGVFQTANFGGDWSNATAPLGLPNVIVTDLKAMPLQGYLYAATYGRGIFRIRIRNNDPVAGLLFSPERVNGGQTITGTVLLGTNAPTGGKTVTLTSDNPAAASVPATVVVPAGQSQANFTITTSAVGGTTPVKITASVSGPSGTPGLSKSGTVTVLSGKSLPFLQSFVFDEYGSGLTLGRTGSFTATGIVTLNKAAPSPITVTITSSSSGATVPASVVVQTGQTSAQFPIQLNPVAAPETTTITAKLGAFVKTITATRN